MPTTHELNSPEVEFRAVLAARQMALPRHKGTHQFAEGQTILLREQYGLDPSATRPADQTLRTCRVQIQHVLDGDDKAFGPGIMTGFCVLSIKRI